MYLYKFMNTAMHMINGIYSKYLVFRFSNPNLTALFLASIFMFLVIAILLEKRILYKLLMAVVAAAVMQFIYLSESRNAQIAMLMFAVFLIFAFFHRKKQIHIPKWIVMFMVIVPILFLFVYLNVITNQSFRQIFSFFSGEGKSLYARYGIWTNALNNFRQSPFVGSYYQSSGGTGMAQQHNIMLDILVTYGLPILILVVIFLYAVITRVLNESQNNYQVLSVFAFICTLFLGIGEAAMFSGGLGIYLFTGIFLSIGNSVLRKADQE